MPVRVDIRSVTHDKGHVWPVDLVHFEELLLTVNAD